MIKKLILYLFACHFISGYLSGQPIIIRKFHFLKTDLLIGQGAQTNPSGDAKSEIIFIRSNNDYRYKNLNGNVLYEKFLSNLEDGNRKVALDIDQIEAKARLIYYIFGYNYYYAALSAQRHTVTEKNTIGGKEHSSSTLNFTYLIPGFGAQISRALFGLYYGFGQQRYAIDEPGSLTGAVKHRGLYDGNLYHIELDSGGRVFGHFFTRAQFLSSGFNGKEPGTSTTFTNDRLTLSLGYFLDQNNRLYFEYENRKIQSVIQRIAVESYTHNSVRVYYRFLKQFGVGLFSGSEDVDRNFTGSIVTNALVTEKQSPAFIGLFLQFFINNF